MKNGSENLQWNGVKKRKVATQSSRDVRLTSARKSAKANTKLVCCNRKNTQWDTILQMVSNSCGGAWRGENHFVESMILNLLHQVHFEAKDSH